MISALQSAAQGAAEIQRTGMRESFKLLDAPEAWVIVLLVLPACAALAWFVYARESVSPRARGLLAALRFASLLLLLAVVFRPVFVSRREEIRPAEVLVLVDDSASMRRVDTYAADAETRRLLSSFSDRPAEESTRLELASAAVRKKLLPALAERGYVARLHRFSDRLDPLDDPATLAGRGSSTHVGSAIVSAISGQRGRNVTEVVVVTDGRSNGGTQPLEAARAAAAAGIPVHTLVVGDTHPERNLIVEIAEAPPSVLEGDEIEFTIRVLARGTQGPVLARVVLEEVDASVSPGSRSSGSIGRPVAEEEIEVGEGGTRVVLVAPPQSSNGQTPERRFRISVPPIEDETLRDDNSVEVGVHVAPEKIRVLYVDAYPRYEYRFLHTLLQRSDVNLSTQCFLMSATPDFPQESSPGLPSLRAIPTDRKTLLDSYDVIILGDVNPYAISPDPSRCEEFMASVHEFVERGGGLVMIAGEYDDPRAFAGTPLEDLLPVVLDASAGTGIEGTLTETWNASLEDPANPHEVVRLVPDARVNRELWEDEGGLAGFYWYCPVLRAKPGAQVLLRHPRDANSNGRFPILVAGWYPSGRTLFVGFDETWRWQYRFGTRYHERFWRNAIRWVALSRLRSGDRRVQIDALKSRYDLDERVTLEARVLDEDYRPSERPDLGANLTSPEGTVREVRLERVPDRPGLFRASFDVERPGMYVASVAGDTEHSASAEFEVAIPSRENADPSPDPETLASIASLSRGRARDLAHVQDLLSEFPGNEERREPISSELDDAWDHWGTLGLALFLLSLEWALRKRWELI
ncbi:MAG: VWA domain-containing protein [Planctomycetota bacterium]